MASADEYDDYDDYDDYGEVHVPAFDPPYLSLSAHISLYLALLALVLELALLAASFLSSLPGSPSVRGGGTTMGRWGKATPSSISDVDDDEELVIKSLPEWVRRKLRGAVSHQ